MAGCGAAGEPATHAAHHPRGTVGTRGPPWWQGQPATRRLTPGLRFAAAAIAIHARHRER